MGRIEVERKKKQILDLANQGFKEVEIAKKVGLAQSTVSKHLNSLGIYLRDRNLTEEEKEIIRIARIEGFSIGETAQYLGIKPTTVYRQLWKMGFPLSDKVTEQETQYIQDLSSKGHTIAEIMRLTGRGRQTVMNHLKRGGNSDGTIKIQRIV